MQCGDLTLSFLVAPSIDWKPQIYLATTLLDESHSDATAASRTAQDRDVLALRLLGPVTIQRMGCQINLEFANTDWWNRMCRDGFRFTDGDRQFIAPVRVSEEKLMKDQLVRLVSYPGSAVDRPLSVDWGRVLIIEGDVGRKVFCNLLSDGGSSGGAVLDTEGELVGVHSHGADVDEEKATAIFEPPRDLVTCLQKLLFPRSLPH